LRTHKQEIFEDRALRRIFGLKRDEIIGGRGTLHNEGLHNLYSSSDIRMMRCGMRWTGHIASIRQKSSIYRNT
jgi:hypothetical protein